MSGFKPASLSVSLSSPGKVCDNVLSEFTFSTGATSLPISKFLIFVTALSESLPKDTPKLLIFAAIFESEKEKGFAK